MPTAAAASQRKPLSWLALWLGAFLASPGMAQNVAANGVTAYPADYFAAYSPSNARDMIDRLPGFTLVEAD
ncbi:MAG: hypothetical protein ABWZ08_11240, partial [Pseudoxanthomonas sp.]